MRSHREKSSRFPLWLAYVAPMAAFMLLTGLEDYAPIAAYVWLYAAKVVAVTTLLLVLRAPLREIHLDARVLLPAIVVGLFVFAQWIALDEWISYPHLGSRAGFNPFTAIEDPIVRVLFLSVRFFGLVIIVPVMEEIFWRSFLLRYATHQDFDTLPIGTFSWTAFALVGAGFALAHSEWLVAIIAACAYALLLRYTRSLFACIVAHSVTNLALGLYILRTGDWAYW